MKDSTTTSGQDGDRDGPAGSGIPVGSPADGPRPDVGEGGDSSPGPGGSLTEGRAGPASPDHGSPPPGTGPGHPGRGADAHTLSPDGANVPDLAEPPFLPVLTDPPAPAVLQDPAEPPVLPDLTDPEDPAAPPVLQDPAAPPVLQDPAAPPVLQDLQELSGVRPLRGTGDAEDPFPAVGAQDPASPTDSGSGEPGRDPSPLPDPGASPGPARLWEAEPFRDTGDSGDSPEPGETAVPPLPPDSPLEREYLELLDILADECSSPPGAEAAALLRPSLDPEGILASWELVREAHAVLLSAGSLELSSHLDLTPLLEKAMPEGAVLPPEELMLLKDEALCSRTAKLHLRPFETDAPGLWRLTRDLEAFSEFIEAMDRSLSPEGDVLDRASPELARIRRETAAARRAVTDRLLSLMRSEEFRHTVRDEIVTVRQDRFVIPVRASGTGKARGLVHDWSKSGQTAYLEPLEAVEDNNRLAFLRKAEAAEIERILARLSAMSREAAGALAVSGKILTRLDLILAEGRLAMAWNATAPEYRPGEGLDLKALRHPLLERRLAADRRRMTPLDFRISPDSPVTVISGLNAGGKTVALKTLGLAVLLARTGLFVPCAPGSSVDFPSAVMAVMGDNQDLDSDLSTFSGHVSALKPVLALAGRGALVLLDELGGGTDPAEGQALALAVLEELMSTGAWIVSATHFHLVKTWASLTPGVVSAAVNTGADGSPAYGISYGAPGFSGGLAMAERLGLPAGIVMKARGYLDDGHRRSLELLRRLDEARAGLLAERRAAGAEREEAARELGLERDRLAKETARVSRMQKQSDQELRAFMSRYRAAFDRLRAEVKEAAAAAAASGGPLKFDPQKISDAKASMGRDAAAVRPETPGSGEVPPAPRDLNPGDRVFIRRLGRPGTVLAWNPAKLEGTVESGKFSLRASWSELGAWSQGTGRKSRGGGTGAGRGEGGSGGGGDGAGPPVFFAADLAPPPETGVPGSLMLVGSTVEDALEAIEREIDRAVVAGRPNLTIIHGRGTGRLKAGIAGYLRRHPRVRGFSTPEKPPERGGVTEVLLEA